MAAARLKGSQLELRKLKKWILYQLKGSRLQLRKLTKSNLHLQWNPSRKLLVVEQKRLDVKVQVREMQHQGMKGKEGEQSEGLAILKGLCTKKTLFLFANQKDEVSCNQKELHQGK